MAWRCRPPVGEGGLEPPPPCGDMALNHARLPVPPLALVLARAYALNLRTAVLSGCSGSIIAAQVATDTANGRPWRLEATPWKIVLDQVLDHPKSIRENCSPTAQLAKSVVVQIDSQAAPGSLRCAAMGSPLGDFARLRGRG